MAAPDVDSLLAGLGPVVSKEMTVVEDPERDVKADGLEMAAGDLIAAVQAGDPKMVVAAFKAMFDMAEMQPHVEESIQVDG